MTPDAAEPDRSRDADRDPDLGGPGDPLAGDPLDGGPGDPLAGGPAPAGPPERRPLNTSGWVALALGAAAFGASVLVAWPGAVLLAALALALALTGVVRVYRGRATNKGAALGALVLAVATVILGFVWANQAQPCVRLSNDQDKFNACYESHTGLW